MKKGSAAASCIPSQSLACMYVCMRDRLENGFLAGKEGRKMAGNDAMHQLGIVGRLIVVCLQSCFCCLALDLCVAHG